MINSPQSYQCAVEVYAAVALELVEEHMGQFVVLLQELMMDRVLLL